MPYFIQNIYLKMHSFIFWIKISKLKKISNFYDQVIVFSYIDEILLKTRIVHVSLVDVFSSVLYLTECQQLLVVNVIIHLTLELNTLYIFLVNTQTLDTRTEHFIHI